MRKTKTQKGITLVALIITIVVLLILAVVAITAIQDEDLIEKANSAATTYNQSVNNESTQLGNYANIIDGYLSNITAGGNGGQTSGSIAWTQSGTTITGSNGATVPVGTTVTNYTEGGLTWKVLGAQNNKLLLMPTELVGSEIMHGEMSCGHSSSNTSLPYLDNLCSSYADATYAESTRSVMKEDITRLGELTSLSSELQSFVKMESRYWLNNHSVDSSSSTVTCNLSAFVEGNIYEDQIEISGDGGEYVSGWHLYQIKIRPVVILKPTVTITNGALSIAQ